MEKIVSLSTSASTAPAKGSKSKAPTPKQLEASPPIKFEVAVGPLAQNLQTADGELRVASLHLLLALAPADATPDASSVPEVAVLAASGVRGLLEILVGIETAPMDAINGKERGQKLTQLRAAIEYDRIPPALLPVLLPFFLGQLRCRFTMPWPEVRACICSLAKMHPGYSLLSTLHPAPCTLNPAP